MEDLHKEIIEAGLTSDYELFLKVQVTPGIPNNFSSFSIFSDSDISIYLTLDQKKKLETVLNCYRYLSSGHPLTAFPPSIGRGGIEQALSISDEELEKLIQKANIKKLGKKFGL